jgi:DNA-binding NarL/FixJ family response regulator
MIDPVKSSPPGLPAAGAQGQSMQPQATKAAAKFLSDEKPPVSIELTDELQARILKGQGRTIPEIALTLRIDEITVRSYFIPRS